MHPQIITPLNKNDLTSLVRSRKNFLCVGLDTDIEKIPQHLLAYENPVLEFNRAIIEATQDICIAYKINTAFYEWMGAKGWDILEQTRKAIPERLFTIADAKRGDIGNTSGMYAKAFFDTLNFDAVTVHPYMGRDSVEPFLQYKDKWTIVLGLTSNPGSADFEQEDAGDRKVYEMVLEKSAAWGSDENMMYVIGATKANELEKIRKIIPGHFLLVPGVGAQGGNLEEVCRSGKNKDGGLLINASRSIIYASSGKDFAEKAREEAISMANQMYDFV